MFILFNAIVTAPELDLEKHPTVVSTSSASVKLYDYDPISFFIV